MEKFAVIIPDRGDRPELTEHCFHQLSRMTRKPDEVIHVNFKPADEGYDLVERLHYGVMAAQGMGIDLCFVVENDDYYSPDYFERFGDMSADFFGDDLTFYYNLKNRTFKSFYHIGRSSLFTTGFRASKIEGFQFGGDNMIDIRLWKFAKEKGLKTSWINSGCVGVKHGLGLCGGKGHQMNMDNYDPKMNWLKGRVDQEAFEFYQSLSHQLMHAY